MSSIDLRERTKAFALRIIKLVAAVPRNRDGDIVRRQLLKSGTSIGANWREACRASSKRHFITSTEICLREADESLYWPELLSESNLIAPSKLAPLIDEANPLVAILATTVKNAKRSLQNSADAKKKPF